SRAERSYSSQQLCAPKRQKRASPFVRQLYADGDLLLVKDSEVLVDYFLATASVKPNLGDFLRVLRDFGFARRGLSFTHAHFQRGWPELLHLVHSRRRGKPLAMIPRPLRQISSASLMVAPPGGIARTEMAPLDDDVAKNTVSVDKMRRTVQSLYVIMLNSVITLNAAITKLHGSNEACCSPKTALARSSCGALGGALGGGGQYGGGWRYDNTASPFAEHLALSGTPGAVDAHHSNWPCYPASAASAPYLVVAAAQAGLHGPPAAPAAQNSKKRQFECGNWCSPSATPTYLLPSHDVNALSLSAGLSMEAAHMRGWYTDKCTHTGSCLSPHEAATLIDNTL
ncbi:hypothetical protein T492DRAFT_1035711, partial [Pavlovales sp. CCMP2436]